MYTTIGELYDYICAETQRTGRDLLVVDALRKMRAGQLLSAVEPESAAVPYSEGREGFIRFLNSVSVDAGSLLREGHNVYPEEEEDIFPRDKDVFSFLCMPNSAQHLHFHKYFELLFILRGNCRFRFEGDNLLLKEGDICITSSLARHEAAPVQDGLAVAVVARQTTFDRVFSVLLSRQDLVSLFFRKCLRNQDHPNYVLLHTGSDEELFYTLWNLVQESHRTDEYANECSANLLSLFLARAIRASAADVTLRHYDGYSRQDFDFSMILHYIQQNYRTVTLSSLADAFHFSESYLSRMIQKNLNQSFTEVLRDLKMNRAVELLRTNMKIGEVSDAVGYVSVDHFARTFHRVYGMPPREWRKQQRGDNDEED